MLTRWQAYEDFFKRILLERRTLRSRFAMYLVTLFGILTSAVMVLLILSGFLNPLDHDLEKFMDYELWPRCSHHETYRFHYSGYFLNTN